jgi:hypothetical protein
MSTEAMVDVEDGARLSAAQIETLRIAQVAVSKAKTALGNRGTL